MGGEVVKLDASSFQIQSLAWSTSSRTLFVGAEVNVFLEPVAKLGGGRTEYCPPPAYFGLLTWFQHDHDCKPFFIKGDSGVGTFDVGGGALPSFLVQIFQLFGCTPN